MSSGFADGLWSQFLNWIYSNTDISVPSDFHSRCEKINELTQNDISGLVNTLLDYSINSASETKYNVECSEETLQKLLNIWLSKINLNIKGVPTGLQALAKEYFQERWHSSFCILRFKNWEKISADGVTIEVPTVFWFVNGSSIYVDRPNEQNYKLGSDEFYLDKSLQTKITENKNDFIVVQKPFNRWFDEYPVPYLVRKGVLKNWLAMKTLQDKSDEVISKFLPYLFVIQKGTESLFLQGDVTYSDTELKTMVDNFKSEIEKYKNQKGKTPTSGIPFDQKYEHLIPDLRRILTEELYRQGNRSILAGLGFVDLLEITPSRQESRLNPKPFVAEVNAGVGGFKLILEDVISVIINKNLDTHKKLFSLNTRLNVVNTPLKINTENILDQLRSAFIYGTISVRTYQEILGVDPETERERRQKELDEGLEDLFYPHLIQNREDVSDRLIPSNPKTTKKQTEKQKEKEKLPQHMEESEIDITENFKNAEIEDDLIEAPYKNLNELPKYIKKMTKPCQEVFMATFNSVYEETKDEGKSMSIGISAAKRCMKKQGYIYDKETKTWKK